jgi:hypothetical protein
MQHVHLAHRMASLGLCLAAITLAVRHFAGHPADGWLMGAMAFVVAAGTAHQFAAASGTNAAWPFKIDILLGMSAVLLVIGIALVALEILL